MQVEEIVLIKVEEALQTDTTDTFSETVEIDKHNNRLNKKPGS